MSHCRSSVAVIRRGLPGRDTASLRAALTVADLLIVPVLPATFDMWSLEPLDDLIQEAKQINSDLKVLELLNAADAQGRDNAEAEAAMIMGTAQERELYVR